MRSSRKPITGEYAEQLRDLIRRHENGQLNEEDMRRLEYLNQPSEYECVWK